MLASLDAAGTAGLPEGKLLGNVAALKAPRESALQRLDRGGLAVAHRKGKVVLWFAARHKPALETVMDCLREKAVPLGAVAWTVTDLGRLLPPVQRGLLTKALHAMADAGEVWELRASKGSGRCWLFSKSVQLGSHRVPQTSDGASSASIAAAVHAAYATWRRKAGSSLMAISDLQSSSGEPLPALHEWLRSEAAAGRAELSEGDWSLAPPEVRAAAIVVHGRKFIRVRFPESG